MKKPTAAQRRDAITKVEQAAQALLSAAYHRWHDVERHVDAPASSKAYQDMEETDRMAFVWYLRGELAAATTEKRRAYLMDLARYMKVAP